MMSRDLVRLYRLILKEGYHAVWTQECHLMDGAGSGDYMVKLEKEIYNTSVDSQFIILCAAVNQ